MLDCESGEVVERILRHEGNAVREFYAALPRPAVVGIEATGSMGSFLRLLADLDIPCRVGHPAAIRRAATRRQEHERRDEDLDGRTLSINAAGARLCGYLVGDVVGRSIRDLVVPGHVERVRDERRKLLMAGGREVVSFDVDLRTADASRWMSARASPSTAIVAPVPCYPPPVLVTRTAEFALTVERSRFYALLTPLAATGQMETLLKDRRRDYRKAVHHCWACRIAESGPDQTAAGRILPSAPRLPSSPPRLPPQVIESSKDDGEVGHPGRVLLELLRKHDLEGALVVSRVFGGVKLGVGGVSRAFRDAGQGAINAYLRVGN